MKSSIAWVVTPGLHDVVERVEAFGGEPAGLAHAREGVRAVVGDRVGLAGGAGHDFLHGVRLDLDRGLS